MRIMSKRLPRLLCGYGEVKSDLPVFRKFHFGPSLME